MRSIESWIGVAAALVGFFTKLFLFQVVELEQEARNYSIMFYLLLILVAVYLAMHFGAVKKAQISFIMLFRAGLKASVLFAFTLGLSTMIYYKKVNPEYMQHKIAERVQMAEEADLEELIPADNPMRKLTKEQFVENERVMSETIFNPFNYSSVTIMLFILIGLLYSIIFSVIISRLLRPI
jgi:hypothetical protein